MANGQSHLPMRILNVQIQINKVFKTVFTCDMFAVKTDPGAFAHLVQFTLAGHSKECQSHKSQDFVNRTCGTF